MAKGMEEFFIVLSNGMKAAVSAEDAEYLSRFKWQAQKASGKRQYDLWHAFTQINVGKKKQVRVGMHRVVLARMLNDALFISRTNEIVDHINLDGLDNKRSNLRACTPSENQIHKRIQRNNKTGFKGVQFDKRTERYLVRFTVGPGKREFGGYFDNPIDAAKKYNEMAVKYFGKFALLNDTGEVPHR